MTLSSFNVAFGSERFIPAGLLKDVKEDKLAVHSLSSEDSFSIKLTQPGNDILTKQTEGLTLTNTGYDMGNQNNADYFIETKPVKNDYGEIEGVEVVGAKFDTESGKEKKYRSVTPEGLDNVWKRALIGLTTLLIKKDYNPFEHM